MDDHNSFNQFSISIWVQTPPGYGGTSPGQGFLFAAVNYLPQTHRPLVIQPRCEHLKSLIVSEHECI